MKMAQEKKSASEDIIDLILKDHAPLKELIPTLKEADGDAGERLVAFEKFAPLLISHAKSEEQSLYAKMKKDEEMQVEGLEGDTEHSIADLLVHQIYETRDENEWSAKVKVLAELVEHHIEEEEEDMLPDFKTHSDKAEREKLGAKYLSLKEKYSHENVLPEEDWEELRAASH